jgi:hypothetical protein
MRGPASLLAAAICVCTDRLAGSLLFLALGVLPGIAYGMTVGIAAVRETHRLEPADPPSLPSNYRRRCMAGER